MSTLADTSPTSGIPAAALAAAAASASAGAVHHMPFEADGDHSSDAYFDDDGVSPATGSASMLSVVDCSDRFRHVHGSLPFFAFHVFSLLITIFLLFVALSDPSMMHAMWYIFLEFVMVALFTFELVSRWYLSRSSFFQNRTNIAEAALCATCIFTFVMLLYSRGGVSARAHREAQLEAPDQRLKKRNTEAAEHEVIVLLRFFAQLFRSAIYLRNVIRARQMQQVQHLHHHHHHHLGGSGAQIAV